MSWEVDWSKRKIQKGNPAVWARNPNSYQKRARNWHWATWAALRRGGVKWQHKKPRKLRYKLKQGYVVISFQGLSAEDVRVCDKFNLWIGKTRGRKRGVKEHHLIAAKKYGNLPDGFVVRHLNGKKDDNRPENLVLGTRADNSKDHHDAVIEMMYWRERALKAEGKNVVKVLNQKSQN